MKEKNSVRNKRKKGKRILSQLLAFLLVSGTLNSSWAWDVYAQEDTVLLDEMEKQSEVVTEQSSEDSPEIQSEDVVLMEDETETTEDTTKTVTANTEILQTEESLIIEGNKLFAAPKSAVRTITDWQWTGNPDEMEIQQDEETGVWGLGLPGVTIDNQADFDTVVSMLPASITTAVADTFSSEAFSDNDTDSSHTEELSITWNCEAYAKDENGNWPVSGDYIFKAELPEGYSLSSDTKKLEVTVQLGGAEVYLTQVDGYYQISSAEDLIAFATLVNGGQTTINARLTQDIDMTGKTWTPIGNHYDGGTFKGNEYAGEFDGQNYVISNLKAENVIFFALFEKISSDSVVKNVGVTGSFSGGQYIAGICAECNGIIENCWNGATITVTDWTGAGIAASCTGTIRNCYNIGTINTPNGKDGGSGGIAGSCFTYGTVENCFNFGKVTGNAAAIFGENIKSATNCYYLEGSAPRGIGGTSKTVEQLKSGEVAWLLNGGSSDGVWKQTIGTADYPSFSGGTVYNNDGTYSNTAKTTQAAPSPPTATVTSNSITIGTQTSAVGTTTQYACKAGTAVPAENDWQTTNEFPKLNAATQYTCYVRFAANDSYLASEIKSAVFYTASAKPAASVVTINYSAETISFGSAYEVNTSSNFNGTGLTSGASITDYISAANGTEQKLYVRVKAVSGGAAASEATEITIPKRPQAPAAQVTATASKVTLTQNTAWEYSTDSGNQKSWSSTYEFTQMGQKQTKTCYVRAKATASVFASDIQTIDATTNAAAFTVTIPREVTAGGDAVDIKINSEKAFDLGYNGHVDVKVNTDINDSFQNGVLTLKYTDTQSSVPDITSQMKVGGNPFTDLSKNIASFQTKDAAAVTVQFEKPTQTNIRAGKYNGIVTFAITYGEGQ